MKCIKTLKGIMDRGTKVLRVPDKEARARVASGEALYVSKTEWKKIRSRKGEKT